MTSPCPECGLLLGAHDPGCPLTPPAKPLDRAADGLVLEQYSPDRYGWFRPLPSYAIGSAGAWKVIR